LDELAQCVRQATIILPYFHYEVPVLYVGDGTHYIPVIALCEMLGLRADTHIPRWRKLLLWTNARKLLLRTARGKRIVWCLHLGALPFWCACFNWSLVPVVRREQLRQATDAWLEDVEQAHQLMLDRYSSLRRYLFEFLVSYSDAEPWLDQWALHLSASLDVTSFRQLELLLSQGKTLIGQAIAQARKMVQELAIAPMIDMVKIDTSGKLADTCSLPLFPVVPREDREQFFTYLSKFAQWCQGMAAFMDELILSHNGDQGKET
jgi:hypothetical protein